MPTHVQTDRTAFQSVTEETKGKAETRVLAAKVRERNPKRSSLFSSSSTAEPCRREQKAKQRAPLPPTCSPHSGRIHADGTPLKRGASSWYERAPLGKFAHTVTSFPVSSLNDLTRPSLSEKQKEEYHGKASRQRKRERRRVSAACTEVPTGLPFGCAHERDVC